MYQPGPDIEKLIADFVQSPQDAVLQQQVAELCSSDSEIASYVEKRLLEWLNQGASMSSAPTAPVRPSFLKRSKSRYRWIAGCIIALAGLLGWYYLQQKKVHLQVYTNTTKQVIELPLINQNKITLNKQSSISYNAKLKGTPAIKMLKGDAYIEIDKSKPVAVQLDDQTVLYTSRGAFNVHKSAGIVQVLMIKGTATVIQDEVKEWPLKPYMQVRRQLHKQIIQSKSRSLSALAWKTRALNFRDVPLLEALDGINSFYSIEIALPPSAESLAKRRITANFNNLSVTEIISGLKKILKRPIVKERPGKYYITLK